MTQAGLENANDTSEYKTLITNKLLINLLVINLLVINILYSGDNNMRFTLQPVKGKEFVNRTGLIEEMISDLEDRKSTVGYALYGKRRVGKTSILKEVERQLEKNNEIIVVYFSIWDLVEFTLPEFCQRMSMLIIDAYRPHIGLKYRARDLLNTPVGMLRKILDRAEFKVVFNEIEFLVSAKQETDKNMLVERVFDLSEKLAKSTETKCVLFIDEFPSIIDLKSDNAKIGEPILRKIRTISEDWERTSLSISGSIRSTMELTILSPTSPFYRQMIVKEIKPLEKEYVGEILLRNLRIPDEGIEEIYSFSGGIPFYVQFIGKMLERVEEITLDRVKDVEYEFLTEEGNILFKEEFNALGSKEGLIIANIAVGCHSPKELANIIGERVSNINRFLMYLIEKGYVSKEERGYYVLEDPVFESWLKRFVKLHLQS